MVPYQYRCTTCGDHEVRVAMGTATAHVPCPGCGDPARRVYTAPRTRGLSRAHVAAIDTAGRSAEAPTVTTAIPAAAGTARRPVAHPLHAGLPRP